MLINILFLLIGYFFLIKIYYKKFPFVALAFFQIILLSLWAHLSTFFIDSQAGIYSIELTKNLESNFSSSYRMLFFLLFLIAPFIVFTKKRIQNLKESFQNNKKIEYNFLSFRVYDIVKFLFTVFLILVFSLYYVRVIENRPLDMESGKGLDVIPGSVNKNEGESDVAERQGTKQK